MFMKAHTRHRDRSRESLPPYFTLTFWDLNLNNANYYYYLKDRQSHLVVIFWANGSFEWARTQCSWRHTLGTEIDPGKVYLLVPSSSRLKSLSCVRWWQRKFPFRPSRRRAATPPHRRHAAATSPLHRRHAAAMPLLSLCRCCSAGARGAATIRSSSNAGTLWSKRFEWIQKTTQMSFKQKSFSFQMIAHFYDRTTISTNHTTLKARNLS